MALPGPRLHRSLAFAAGIGIAAIPSVGPFIALLTVFSGRLSIQRSDVWWWGSGALLSLPFIITGNPGATLQSLAQVLAVWLIFRSATEFRRNARSATISADIGGGLVVGLIITLVLGLRRLGGFRFDVARTGLDALVWNSHPATFGHALLILAALLALVVPSPRLRVMAMAIGAIGVIFSGALEAIWVWLFIALSLKLLGRRSTRGTVVAEWLLIGLMALFAIGVPARLGLGRTGFLTDVAPTPQAGNLFRGTEVARGDWWFALGVAYTGHGTVIDGQPRTGFEVTKVSSDSWARLQQAVTLMPNRTYTLSALLRSPDAARPGFDGWGRTLAGSVVNLGSTVDGLEHRATTSGPMELVSADAEALEDGWVRAFVTFLYSGDVPVTWYVGVVPDRSAQVGITTTFAELQLVTSNTPIPYRPGVASRGVADLRVSRFPIWRDALEAIGAKPLFGWGTDGLPGAMATLHPGEASLRTVAAHAHNSLLTTWVNRGLVGVIGLIGLIAVLALSAIQQRDKAAAVVLAGVLVLNLFDTTFLSGGVIYPLAAVLGWRSVGRREIAAAETGVASAAAVRIGLALADIAAGAFALSLGMYVAGRFDPGISLANGWRMPLVYATFVWPAFAAAAGLYPGYGLPSYKRLSRSVRATTAAAVLVGFLALLVPEAFGLTASVFLVAVPTAAVLAPTLKLFTQKALQQLRLWGRPIVMLGSEPGAAQVARHLLAHPDIGLHPVAIFGTSSDCHVPGVSRGGSLEHAWAYIEANDVRHVIISPGAAKTVGFDRVLLQSGTRLKYVQYLPDLRDLPTNSVVAVALGTTLGLEVRNQLGSTTNRAVKRVTDLFGATVLLLALGPALLLVAALIALDSRGPVFYVSPRIGRYGRRFGCIKFRTMRTDADKRLQGLLSDHPELQTQYELYHKLENDPRVTRVGRFLRRLSLDELPQLVNVLLGEMSLVGPRPYMVSEHELMGSDRDLIFLARPGMTGYWQIEARNDVSFAERQSMEAHYVRNWSLWWDIDILLKTPGAILRKTGS